MKFQKTFFNSTFYFFGILGVIFIPASSLTLSFQNGIAETVFGDQLTSLLDNYTGVSSDSVGMYFMLLCFLVFSMILSFLLGFSSKWQRHKSAVFAVLGLIFVYYLSSRMFIYGFDKIFKSQFYLPEPNTLYTPVGYLSKDILYWTALGTSRSYNLIVGFLEVIPAILFLFKRTRIIGLLMCFGILLHVLAINIGFDISVKLYSFFLLILTVGLLSPQLKVMYQFFILKKTTALKVEAAIPTLLSKEFLRTPLKTFIIILILIDCLFIPISTSNFNDDSAERPFLHGAYTVKQGNFQNINERIPLKRIFIHRRGFIIFQFKDDHMEDYQFKIDEMSEEFILTDYYNERFILPFVVNNDQLNWLYYGFGAYTLWLELEPLDWEELPVLQDDFHWVVEGY